MKYRVRFMSKLVISPAFKDDPSTNLPLFQLERPFACTVNIDRREFIVSIPYGFETDFASVPKWLHWMYEPDDSSFIYAAVLHDYLYEQKGIITFLSQKIHLTRKDCDKIYASALRMNGCSKFDVFLQYYAIRLFGSKMFKE